MLRADQSLELGQLRFQLLDAAFQLRFLVVCAPATDAPSASVSATMRASRRRFGVAVFILTPLRAWLSAGVAGRIGYQGIFRP